MVELNKQLKSIENLIYGTFCCRLIFQLQCYVYLKKCLWIEKNNKFKVSTRWHFSSIENQNVTSRGSLLPAKISLDKKKINKQSLEIN